MIIFIFDLTWFILIALVASAGIIGSLAEWILDNILIVSVILIIKSVIVFSGCGLFSPKKNTVHVISTIFILFLDIVRNIPIILCISNELGEMLSGGIFDLFLGSFDVLIILAILFFVGECPVFLVYDWELAYDKIKLSILLELVANVASFLVALYDGALSVFF